MSLITPLKKIAFATASLALITSASAAMAGHHGKKVAASKEQPTIVGVAAANGNFKTLVAAVKAAGLVDTLNSDGPFTVFAPTDGAFAKLPEGAVSTLVKPENKGTLTSILTYHVIAGKVTAKDVLALVNKHGGSASVTTVQGGKLKITKNRDGSLTLTDAKGGKSSIVATDVMASNGVIHVIDSVVMP